MPQKEVIFTAKAPESGPRSPVARYGGPLFLAGLAASFRPEL